MSQNAEFTSRLPDEAHTIAALRDARGDLVARSDAKPHVVIVGAGFGGLTTAQSLAKAAVKVTVIDKHNYHLFQPLLYQVATAGLSPAQIAAPIRAILRRQKNADVLLGEVTGVDTVRREVQLGAKRLSYDYLVLATGARHSYFGHDEWEPFAPGLKSLEDATEIRRRILLSFEEAEAETDLARRTALLTFVVIGGGPTGVELAGKIVEIARHALLKDFRNIDPSHARVLLVEAGSRLLPTFPKSLSQDAQARLQKLGVEVRLGQPVTQCDASGAVVGGALIPAGTIVWAAGVAASPAARWLGVPSDRAGRAIVGPRLTAPGHDDIFVIGDTAGITNPDGAPVPGLAAAAKQEGAYEAASIKARISNAVRARPFAYTNLGNLATVGRNAAVIDFGKIRLTGFVAWLMWSVIHLYFLIGFRNRVIAFVDWIGTYLTYERSARLITGPSHSPCPPAARQEPH
ncbi:MAG TPA: NAD(P)/FAD-dependent oxidoreductase [Rhizomicrobium sp.]|nr:NAD(P)/FAD-dependent oxidoreductase [Rhizomicrobium sp.]